MVENLTIIEITETMVEMNITNSGQLSHTHFRSEDCSVCCVTSYSQMVEWVAVFSDSKQVFQVIPRAV